MIVRTMKGLGDTLYQRPFIREMAKTEDLYVETPWPEYFDDLPVRFIHDDTRLRTQRKNVARQVEERFYPIPTGHAELRFRYGRQHLATYTIMGYFQRLTGVVPGVMDCPPLPDWPPSGDKPIAVVRPVTVRKEWRNEARNCDADYVRRASVWLRGAGYCVVSIADLDDSEEWAVDPLPEADITMHAGELSPLGLLYLLTAASVAVGSIGMLLPVCISTRTPMLCIAGGSGAVNNYATLVPDYVDWVTWAQPDPFCRCTELIHDCNRHIPDFDHYLEGLPRA